MGTRKLYLLQFAFCSVWVSFVLASCATEVPATSISTPEQAVLDRLKTIPEEAVKYSPEQDDHPPLLHSNEFSTPRPLEGPINTAGAEDSPFISPDGQLLFFFFTPDVDVPVEQQLLDGVTGIYLARRVDTAWADPERLILQDEGMLALDGCAFFDGDSLWFCSAREGYTGVGWFRAVYAAGVWSDWRPVDFDPAYEVGELHIYADELYFHSRRPGGHGEMDLWMSRRVEGAWLAPTNLVQVNSVDSEGYPFLTSDGRELWFTRWYQGTPAIYRSFRADGGWGDPELIVSQFAGEPTLDPEGNLYFVHHYYQDGNMIEADIYVAERR